MTTTLTDLSIAISNPSMDRERKCKKTVEFLFSVLPRANRITLWRFIAERTAIECLYGATRSGRKIEAGVILTACDYPDYFAQILNENVLVAPDARQDPFTRGFNKDYFEPNNIYSLLDYIFHHDFEPVGIICCESVDEKVEWQQQDVEWLRRTAGVVSMFY